MWGAHVGHAPCPFLLVHVQRLRGSWKGPAGEMACGHAHCWGAGCGARGGAGGGPLLFSLAHFLGLLVSSLCGSGDRDDP